MAAARPRMDISADPEALAHRVAQWVTDLACHAGGRFSVALSGGSTPKRLYQLLAGAPYKDAMPWDRVHWFWGDDRFVPWDAPGTHADAAGTYERELKSYYGADKLDPARPLFDVVLLGMGPDGHTASLFPGKPAVEERQRWVTEVPEPGLNPHVPRVTLTYPALESSKSVAFVAAGADKHTMMQRVLAGDRALPSAGVHPVGELVWFIDQAAQRGA